MKTKIPHRRVLKKHVGYLHDEKEDPLTAKWLRPAVDDVKRQPAGPRSNVDRRSDASTLQSGFARAEGAERYLRRGSVTGAQNLSDHRHRCGGLVDAGKQESFTKC